MESSLDIQLLGEVESSLDMDEHDDPYGLMEFIDGTITLDDLPKFNGDPSNPDTFLDWIDRIEYIFKQKRVKDTLRVELAVHSFKPFALLWWNNLQIFRVQEGLQEITTWSEMRDVMYNKFVPVPDTYKRGAYKRLLNWKEQGDMSIEENNEVFEKLCYRADIKWTDEQMVYLYISGLCDDELPMDLLTRDVTRTSKAMHTAWMHYKKLNTLQHPIVTA